MFYKLPKELEKKNFYFVVRKRSLCIKRYNMNKKIYLEDLVKLLFSCEVEVVDQNGNELITVDDCKNEDLKSYFGCKIIDITMYCNCNKISISVLEAE